MVENSNVLPSILIIPIRSLLALISQLLMKMEKSLTNLFQDLL
nr:MAG TPA: hypothetical protein [Caudoviricetes sp.]